MCGFNASRFSVVIHIQLPWLGPGCIVAEFRFLLSEFYRGFIWVLSRFYLSSIAVFSEEISKIQNEQFSQGTKLICTCVAFFEKKQSPVSNQKSKKRFKNSKLAISTGDKVRFQPNLRLYRRPLLLLKHRSSTLKTLLFLCKAGSFHKCVSRNVPRINTFQNLSAVNWAAFV